MKKILFICSILFHFSLSAQYPSTSTLVADVKKQSPAEFVTVSLVGSWNMFHDKAPSWQAPDAARQQVDIIGKKNADGSYWTYSALAIYTKVGSGFSFNRLFLLEDATQLNGIKLPDNDYFKSIFIKKLESKDPMLLNMNYELKNATAFYSFEIKKNPKISGSGTDLFALFTVEVCLDLPNGMRLEKKVVPIEIKATKNGSDFIFKHAMKKSDGSLIEFKEMGSSEAIEKLPKFGFSNSTLQSFTKTSQSYAVAEGSNGAGFPNDKEIVENMENTFFKNNENFSILFGPKGSSLISSVRFIKKDLTSVSSDKFDVVFLVEYMFHNENSQEKTFKMITAQRELKTSFVKENGKWYVDASSYLNEAKYIKTEGIAWEYRNSYTEKTFDKTKFK